jgi:hypothetical protein
VQNADSSSLFDDLDAAHQSGSSEKRVAVLRQVTDLTRNLDRHSEIRIAGPLTTSARLGSPEIVKALTKSSMDQSQTLRDCSGSDKPRR